MADTDITIIDITFTHRDGQKHSAYIAADGEWQQWGPVDREHLSATVDLLEDMAQATFDHIPSDD